MLGHLWGPPWSFQRAKHLTARWNPTAQRETAKAAAKAPLALGPQEQKQGKDPGVMERRGAASLGGQQTCPVGY